MRVFSLCILICFAAIETPSVVAQTDAATVSAQQWSQFRGLDGRSSSAAATPTSWTESNYRWKVELPGRGWSSPVYSNDEIWLTAATEVAASKAEVEAKLKGVQFAQIKTAVKSITMFALCVDLNTGKIVKSIELGTENDPQPNNPMNSYASPTCAIADGKVVCHFGAHGTWCVDARSKQVLWDRKFVIDHSVGAGSSPIIDNGKVILVCDGMDQQYVTAIDLQSGSNIWRTDRPKIIADSPEFMKSYSTPIVLSIDGARQAVVPGANWVCGYDVESGQEVWRAKYGFGYSVTPMAVFAQGNFVISTGYGESKFVAVKPGKGDVSDSIQWTARNAPAMSSFIVDSDIIYAVGDRPGTLRAIDAKTGKVLKKQRFLPNVSASILNAGGHLYIGSRDGIMKVVKCDPELEEVSKFDFGSPVYATPVVIENDLLVRTKDFMVRIGK